MGLRILKAKVNELVLVPYKIDQHGTIHIVPMVKSEHKGYKARMKRLVAMGVFSKDVLEIKKDDEGNKV